MTDTKPPLLTRFTEAVRKLAEEMPPPNPYTPRLIAMCIEVENEQRRVPAVEQEALTALLRECRRALAKAADRIEYACLQNQTDPALAKLAVQKEWESVAKIDAAIDAHLTPKEGK